MKVRCARCGEKISSKAFYCRYCNIELVPYASSVLSTMVGMFNKEKFYRTDVIVREDATHDEIISVMNTAEGDLTRMGYSVLWRWDLSYSPNVPYFSFSCKGESNYAVYLQVFNVMANHFDKQYNGKFLLSKRYSFEC